jgi:RNA polymerase sigma factor FliA
MDDTEKQLWQDYRQTKSVDLRNQLVERYLPLAWKLSKRKAGKLPKCVEFDDLYSAAYQALIGSVPRFDLARGISPTTFFTYRISGGIADWLRSIDSVSRHTRQRQTRVTEWAQSELDHYPTDDEIFDEFGFKLHRPATISLQEPITATDSRARTIGDLLADRRSDPSETDLSNLSDILKGCSKRERLALLLYHFDGHTMRELGDAIGVSESRVSQMMSQLKQRLQAAA